MKRPTINSLKKHPGALVGGLVMVGLYLTSLYSYPLFHSLAEIFSIVVAFAIFVLAWNTRGLLDNNYLLFIGIAYLFVGGLDLLHALAYKGMGAFPGYAADLPTQLWIGARYLESLSLLVAFLFLKRKVNAHLTFIGYAAVSALFLLSIFFWDVFPACFVEGAGLTLFKKSSEYIISLVLVGSMILLLKNRGAFDPAVIRWLAVSFIVTIGAELAFTFYISVYGLSNLFGHLLKVVSFYFIYKALIQTGLVKPYSLLFRNLRQSEEACRGERDFVNGLINTAPAIVLLLNSEGRIIRFNHYMEELSGYRLEEVQGKDWFTTFLPDREREGVQEVFARTRQRQDTTGSVNPIVNREGKERLIEWHNESIWRPDGELDYILSVGQDVTERKLAEAERERLIAQLQAALAEVKRLSGLIPICSSCKKIRDDQGYWTRVEEYIQEHSEAEFTHGICPECKEKLYPGL